MKIIWSLFDGSGHMVKPWADAGCQCYCFNWSGGNHGEYTMRVLHPNIVYVDSLITGETWEPVNYPSPDIIFSFPDCTFMAQSGSQHDRTDDQVNHAVSLARVAENLGDKFKCPWMVENPRGSLSTKWRKADYYFDPYQYGGYMTGSEEKVSPQDAVIRRVHKENLYLGGKWICYAG